MDGVYEQREVGKVKENRPAPHRDEKDGGLRLGRGLRVSLSQTPRRGPPGTSEKAASPSKVWREV